MNARVYTGSRQLSLPTHRLLDRMLAPATGLCQQIGFLMRSPLEARLAVAGGDMTGVHVLRGLGEPRSGSHHIGGCAPTYDEAIIKTLGETVERYAQQSVIVDGRVRIQRASYQQMVAAEHRVLGGPGFELFTPTQLARPGFPFTAIDAHTPIGWVALSSLPDHGECWAPAQVALLGYRRAPDEPRFMLGVSTGTAAHTDPGQALERALLELIQIDSVMGHWYGRGVAVPLAADERTRAVTAVVQRHTHRDGPRPRFYWLPNADLPGFTIACLVEDDVVPKLGVGLGCSLRLDRAIYSAFLEGIAVAQLAKVIQFRQAVGDLPPTPPPDALYDLDLNVSHYAVLGAAAVRRKFPDGPPVRPSELPADFGGGPRDLIESFAKTNKALAWLDMTTPDLRSLGFYVARVWSPETLSLCFPSAPPLRHPRFAAYGAADHESPHPYP